MTRKMFEKVCFSVNTGESRVVENRGVHDIGTIHSCGPDSFRVRVDGEEREWGRLVCEEITGEET